MGNDDCRFCTLVVMAYSKRAYAYVLVAVLACSATYIVIQPILRYRYLVSSLLILLAFDGAARLVGFRNRKSDATDQPISA